MYEAYRGGANSAVRPSRHHDEAEDSFYNESEMAVIPCCCLQTRHDMLYDADEGWFFKGFTASLST
jgi:hypothetical protein